MLQNSNNVSNYVYNVGKYPVNALFRPFQPVQSYKHRHFVNVLTYTMCCETFRVIQNGYIISIKFSVIFVKITKSIKIVFPAPGLLRREKKTPPCPTPDPVYLFPVGVLSSADGPTSKERRLFSSPPRHREKPMRKRSGTLSDLSAVRLIKTKKHPEGIFRLRKTRRSKFRYSHRSCRTLPRRRKYMLQKSFILYII